MYALVSPRLSFHCPCFAVFSLGLCKSTSPEDWLCAGAHCCRVFVVVLTSWLAACRFV